VARILQKVPNERDRINEVFLATLSRPPGEAEMKLSQAYLEQAVSPEAGLQGLMWSLLNSNGFLFNQ
jgi:hypothetical protein